MGCTRDCAREEAGGCKSEFGRASGTWTALEFAGGLRENGGVQTLTVHGLQYDLAWEDAPANCARVEQFLTALRPAPGSLVALPEMFSSGFSFQVEAASQLPGGNTERFLADLARRHGVWLVAGLAVGCGDGKARNESVAFSPTGEVVTRYRKQRPFSPGGEHLHYLPGKEPVVFLWGQVPVALFVCYDLRFPELFRVAAARWRPELYVVIASWPDKRVAHWVKLLQARAIENQAWVLGVNRTGSDPSHRYVGRSILVNPWGEITADAGETEGWASGDLDLAALRDYREKLPFLADLTLPC
jgi:omega-amidase